MAIAHMTAEDRRRLADLVAEHEVLYEVYPQKSYATGRPVSVGYDVELLGLSVGGTHGVLPGCERCIEVWKDLRQIGAAVMPDDRTGPSRYEIEPFDAALHFSGSRSPQGRENIRLTLAIRHKDDYQAPIDASEEQCLHDVVSDLRSLGARERE